MIETLNFLEGISPVVFVVILVVALLQLFRLKQDWRAENRSTRLWILALCFGTFVLFGFSSALSWYRHNHLDRLAGPVEKLSSAKQGKEDSSPAPINPKSVAPRPDITTTERTIAALETASPFSVTSIDGQTFEVPAPGKVVVINFFATWCDTCMAELPHLQKIWEQNKDNPRFELISIGRDETDETVKAFREKYKFTQPFASDSRAAIVAKYGVEEIPHTFVIGPYGKIALSKIGFEEGDQAELQAAVDKAMAQSN